MSLPVSTVKSHSRHMVMRIENIVVMNAILQADSGKKNNESRRTHYMAAFKKERKMKVYAQSGYHYKDTATIILKGAWLETLGFEPGTPINVECDGGRLVITRADEVIVE